MTAVVHTVYGQLRTLTGARGSGRRDRGAVSLEHVLWYVAAGVAVAVIAGVIWAQIKNEAQKPVSPPAAP